MSDPRVTTRSEWVAYGCLSLLAHVVAVCGVVALALGSGPGLEPAGPAPTAALEQDVVRTGVRVAALEVRMDAAEEVLARMASMQDAGCRVEFKVQAHEAQVSYRSSEGPKSSPIRRSAITIFGTEQERQ